MSDAHFPKAKRSFGQNFLVDQSFVAKIVKAAALNDSLTVVEIGPGRGALTRELLSHAGKVVAIELDRDLASLLREQFADRANFQLIEQDALEVDFDQIASKNVSPIKLVANLPYNIASPLIIELLIAGVDLLAFTVQKEVADRLRAKENDDAYGPLSVMASSLARVEVLRTLPPQAFWPAPKSRTRCSWRRLGIRSRPSSAYREAPWPASHRQPQARAVGRSAPEVRRPAR